MAPPTTGRQRQDSVAKKREAPPVTASIRATDPAPKRRLSSTGVALKVPPQAPLTPASASTDSAPPEATAKPAVNQTPGQGNDGAATNADQTNRVQGDVAEKRLRSFKSVKDNLDGLIRKRTGNRERAMALAKEAGVDNWVNQGHHLGHHFFRSDDKPLTPIQETLNKILELSIANHALNKVINEETHALFKISIDKPGNAKPSKVFKTVFDEQYTLEEALRRPSPVIASKFDEPPTWAKPNPIIRDTPIDIMVEGGPGWRPEWDSL